MAFGFLTNKELKKELPILIPGATFVESQAGGASYDLTLGSEVYISEKEYPEILTQDQPYVSLPRGQFALLMTDEQVEMPSNYLGMISIRFSIKKRGLINVSGFHVDPGFKGRIIFSVFNAGPSDVVLKYKDPVFMIFFFRLEHDAKPYPDTGYKDLPVDLVTSLKGTSTSLSGVDERVSKLETTYRIFWGILIALIGALIALFVRGVIS
jgi:dCTP deaminase